MANTPVKPLQYSSTHRQVALQNRWRDRSFRLPWPLEGILSCPYPCRRSTGEGTTYARPEALNDLKLCDIDQKEEISTGKTETTRVKAQGG